MNKWLEIRKRKAADRMRLRAQVAKGEVRPEDVSIAAALGPSFYKAPFSVDHIRLDDDETTTGTGQARTRRRRPRP